MLRLVHSAPQGARILKALANELPNLFSGGESKYVLEFSDAEERRTKLQNSFLYGWVYPQLAKALTEAGIKHPSGETYCPTLVRLELMIKFRQCGSIVQDGREYPDYKSTAKMGKKEFSAFIDAANHYYIERDGVGLPDHRTSEYYSNMADEIGYRREA